MLLVFLCLVYTVYDVYIIKGERKKLVYSGLNRIFLNWFKVV
jgi:hypothetical protein